MNRPPCVYENVFKQNRVNYAEKCLIDGAFVERLLGGFQHSFLCQKYRLVMKGFGIILCVHGGMTTFKLHSMLKIQNV